MLKTVAEGVEDADTFEMLRALGVDFAQGYYIGRPQPMSLDALPAPTPSDAQAGARPKALGAAIGGRG